MEHKSASPSSSPRPELSDRESRRRVGPGTSACVLRPGTRDDCAAACRSMRPICDKPEGEEGNEMTGNQCPYCGQAHPAGTIFCSATGRPLQASPVAPPAPAGPPPPQYGQQTPQPPHAYAPPPQMPPGYGSAPGYAPGGYGQGPPPGPAAYGAPPAMPPPQQAAAYGPPPGYGSPPGYPPPGYGVPGPGGYPPPTYGQAPYGGQRPQSPGYGAGPPLGTAKPIGVILTEAFQLYQKNFGALLLMCAILLVPVSLAKSAAMALILAPTAVVDVAAGRAQQLSQ